MAGWQRIGKVCAIIRLEFALLRCILPFMRDGSPKLVHELADPEVTQHTAQVLQFRPRGRSAERPVTGSPSLLNEHVDHESKLLQDLARYERDAEDEPINYRHRMFMNVIAVVIVTVLVGIGVWLADTIAQMERDQDCVLQGRQNCAPIEIPKPVAK